MGLALLAVEASGAGAQTDGGEEDDEDSALTEASQAIYGNLTAAEEPVEGVTIRVRRDGADVGDDVTDADGTWRVEVSEAGTYEVELATDTLPEGIELFDPDRNVFDSVRVSPGREQRVTFRFDESVGRTVSFVDRLANTSWNGLKLGLVVALASIGLSLVFGTTGLVNFAHAELITFGALAAWFFNSTTIGPDLTLVLASVLAVIVGGAFGAGLRFGVWRPLERRRVGLIPLMIVSIGLGLLLRYGFAVVYETSPRTFAQYAAQPSWTWGPLVFPPKDLVLIPLSLAVLLAVAAALRWTRQGTAIRAVSDSRDLAESSGIDVQRVILNVWISAAALAALGGIVFGMTQAVQWDMGFRLLLTIFAAVILGGVGSVYGPMVGGVVVGMATELSTLWFSAEFKEAFALGALILVLLVRPQGILGIRERIG
ncbi:MAG: ABC transporter permease subunit [Acidimicrobiia bacterium]